MFSVPNGLLLSIFLLPGGFDSPWLEYFFLILLCESIKFLFYTHLDKQVKLVILSAGGFCGRMSCGFITRFIKVIDCLILSIAACSALFLGMIALKNVAGFVLLGLLYGYASGMCEILLVSNN